MRLRNKRSNLQTWTDQYSVLLQLLLCMVFLISLDSNSKSYESNILIASKIVMTDWNVFFFNHKSDFYYSKGCKISSEYTRSSFYVYW